MMKLAQEKESLSIVDDQIGAPTYAPFLAKASYGALLNFLDSKNQQSGTYNLCNSGEVSWHGFAKEIFSLAEEYGIPLKISELLPIPSEEYPTPAKRPQNSRMDLELFRESFDLPLPHWKDSLKECMEKYCEVHKLGDFRP